MQVCSLLVEQPQAGAQHGEGAPDIERPPAPRVPLLGPPVLRVQRERLGGICSKYDN